MYPGYIRMYSGHPSDGFWHVLLRDGFRNAGYPSCHCWYLRIWIANNGPRTW